MKPFIAKTIDFISFGTLRRRQSLSINNGSRRTSSQTSTNHVISHSLPSPIELVKVEESIEIGEVGSWSIYHTSPSPEVLDPQEDDVLFCKNNIYLKYSLKNKDTLASSYSSSDSSLIDSLGHPTRSEGTDQVQLIPGYMQISTRGTDFGQTLILNWTSNSQMYHLSNQGAVGGSSSTKSSCFSSISIDLGATETVRIFYQLTNGLISSGELIIINKERKFHMFYFKHSLYDLIKKFRGWKYFSYKHHRELQQYFFTVYIPKLTLSELHEEEGLVNGMLTQSMWKQLQDPSGKVLDKKLVLQVKMCHYY